MEKKFTYEQYSHLDHLVNITYINIASLTKKARRIVLQGVDFKNDDHKFVLKVTEMYSRLNEVPVCVLGGSRFRLWLWNLKNRKAAQPIEYLKEEAAEDFDDSDGVIDVEELLKFESEAIDYVLMPRDLSFGDIYNEYYK